MGNKQSWQRAGDLYSEMTFSSMRIRHFGIFCSVVVPTINVSRDQQHQRTVLYYGTLIKTSHGVE